MRSGLTCGMPAARPCSWWAERQERDIRVDLHLVDAQPGKDEAGGGLGFRLEGPELVVCLRVDHGDLRRPERREVTLGRAGIGSTGAAGTARRACRVDLAVDAKPAGAPSGVASLAGGALSLGRDALLLQREAPATTRQARDRGLCAAHTDTVGPARRIAPTVQSAPCRAAGLADGTVLCGRMTAARCAKPRRLPRPAAAPVPGAVGAPAQFGVPAAVRLALLPGSGAAGSVSGTFLLAAAPAHLEAGLWRGSCRIGCKARWQPARRGAAAGAGEGRPDPWRGPGRA